MRFDQNIAPVGMKHVEAFLKELHKKVEIHRRCEVKPPHFLVYLDAGNGQTTLSEYITDMFVEGKLRHFGSIDAYLEYKLNGSMEQLNEIYTDINKRYAVYMDKYNGVVAIDMKALSTKHNEPQIPFFLNMIQDMKDSATFILYMPTDPNRTLNLLADDLKKDVENLITVYVPTYTIKELVEIVVRTIENKGVLVRGEKTFRIIERMLNESEIINAKDAAALGERFVSYAEFRNGYLVLELEKNFDDKAAKKVMVLGGK